MSERKVLNKYYPPDFDPSKIPRMKLPKNRQYTVRLMAPFNMRCATCGEYIYKGKKFNARKEDVENEDYLGIRIYRFYIKCTRCLQEISFKTDPKNTDYEIEAGATRNFMALKLAEEQAQREEEEAKEEEANNPMKLLENRTQQSKNEIELLESLEELKDLNRRQQSVDYDSMLLQFDTKLSQQEREERIRQMDEDYIKTIKFQNPNKRKVVVEEEIIEELDEPAGKITKEAVDVGETSSYKSNEKISNICYRIFTSKPTGRRDNSSKSVGIFTKKNNLKGLVKINQTNQNHNGSNISTSTISTSTENDKSNNKNSEAATVTSSNECDTTSELVVPPTSTTNSLSLLGAYSDSDDST